MEELERRILEEWEELEEKRNSGCDCYEDRDYSDCHCYGCCSCYCHEYSGSDFEEFRNEKIREENYRISEEFERVVLKVLK